MHRSITFKLNERLKENLKLSLTFFTENQKPLFNEIDKKIASDSVQTFRNRNFPSEITVTRFKLYRQTFFKYLK